MQLWMIRTMHHWLGVLFGAFFFVICVSGVVVMLVQMFDSAPSVQPLSNAQIIQDISVFEVRGLFPDDVNLIVTAPSADQAGYLFRYGDGVLQIYDNAQSAPREQDHGSGFSNIMWNIHANLLNLFGIGHSLVIWSGMIGAYLALLGVIIFIPRRRTFRKSSILHPQELSFREVRRAHFSSGIVFFICVIFFGITGWAAGAPNVAEDILRPPNLDATMQVKIAPGTEPPTIKMLLDSAVEFGGESQIAHLRFLTKNRQPLLYVNLELGDAEPYRRVGFERRYGLLISNLENAPTGLAANLNSNMANLHSGQGRSIIFKLILCITGLIAGLIALTGFVSYIWRWKIQIGGWFKRRKTKDKTA